MSFCNVSCEIRMGEEKKGGPRNTGRRDTEAEMQGSGHSWKDMKNDSPESSALRECRQWPKLPLGRWGEG